MKRVFGILTAVIFGLLLTFTACNKDEEAAIKDNIGAEGGDEISLTSLEPDVVIKGTGENKDYKKVVVQELVKSKECKGEIVSGILEFYYQEVMVFSIDFGNGECDQVATVTWIEKDGTTKSKEVNVWKIFKKNKIKHFKLVLPVSYTMPDGSIITIENKEDRMQIKEWYEANPEVTEKPTLNYPVEIIYKNGKTVTVNNAEEMKKLKAHFGHKKYKKVVVEELVKNDECKEIVSGLIEFYDKKGNWVYSIDFGNGECDGIATKCYMNKQKERECKDFDVKLWKHKK